MNQTYLFILAMILIRISWHRVTQLYVLHYYTLRFMFQNHWEQKYYIPRTQRAVTDQMVPRSVRSASRDRKEISRDDWRVTPSSDYKPQGVVCWTGAPIPKALYHTLCWLYCQWYTHNYMLASSEPKTIITLALPSNGQYMQMLAAKTVSKYTEFLLPNLNNFYLVFSNNMEFI